MILIFINTIEFMRTWIGLLIEITIFFFKQMSKWQMRQEDESKDRMKVKKNEFYPLTGSDENLLKPVINLSLRHSVKQEACWNIRQKSELVSATLSLKTPNETRECRTKMIMKQCAQTHSRAHEATLKSMSTK